MWLKDERIQKHIFTQDAGEYMDCFGISKVLSCLLFCSFTQSMHPGMREGQTAQTY